MRLREPFIILLVAKAIAPWLIVKGPETSAAAVVDVFAPTSAPRGGAFQVSAKVFGCSPRAVVWTASPGCDITSPHGSSTANMICSVVGNAAVRAVAQGGGCAGVFGATSLVIAGDDPVTVDPCDGALPGKMVSSALGWYYRPGVLSTGVVKIASPEKVRQTFQVYECTEHDN